MSHDGLNGATLNTILGFFDWRAEFIRFMRRVGQNQTGMLRSRIAIFQLKGAELFWLWQISDDDMIVSSCGKPFRTLEQASRTALAVQAASPHIVSLWD